jgi:hypothetical protein
VTISLKALADRIIALRGLSAPERRDAVERLLPELWALAKNEAVAVDTRINLITKSARLVDPTAKRCDDPEEAFADLHGILGRPVRAGHPRIGQYVNVTLDPDVVEYIDDEAERRGLVRASGPNRSATIRALLAELAERHWDAPRSRVTLMPVPDDDEDRPPLL